MEQRTIKSKILGLKNKELIELKKKITVTKIKNLTKIQEQIRYN